MGTPPATKHHDREKKLLRKVMKARIACGNSVHELETLNGLTDDWDGDVERLDDAALDIHLQCEYGCKESSTLHEILTGLLTGLNILDWQWTEVELRQENALAATKEITNVLDGLLAAGANPALGVKEMKRRAQHVVSHLEVLEGTFADLANEVQEFAAEAQRQATSDRSS